MSHSDLLEHTAFSIEGKLEPGQLYTIYTARKTMYGLAFSGSDEAIEDLI